MSFRLEINAQLELEKAQWYKQLRLLVDLFPQIQNGKPSYVLEAGVVVKFLYPQRSTPLDIDILVYEDALAELIRKESPFWFHTSTIVNWLTLRGIRPTPSAEQYLRQAYTEIQYCGNPYLCLLPEIIATSKTFNFRGCEPRMKDVVDLSYLRTPSTQLMLIAQQLESK